MQLNKEPNKKMMSSMFVTNINDVTSDWYLERIGPQTLNFTPMFIPLLENEVVIGRLQCISPHISRKHVSFQQAAGGSWFVKDLGSINGTFKNEVKLGQMLYDLNLNDHVSLGVMKCSTEAEFEFRLRKKGIDAPLNFPVKKELVKADVQKLVKIELQKEPLWPIKSEPLSTTEAFCVPSTSLNVDTKYESSVNAISSTSSVFSIKDEKIKANNSVSNVIPSIFSTENVATASDIVSSTSSMVTIKHENITTNNITDNLPFTFGTVTSNLVNDLVILDSDSDFEVPQKPKENTVSVIKDNSPKRISDYFKKSENEHSSSLLKPKDHNSSRSPRSLKLKQKVSKGLESLRKMSNEVHSDKCLNVPDHFLIDTDSIKSEKPADTQHPKNLDSGSPKDLSSVPNNSCIPQRGTLGSFKLKGSSLRKMSNDIQIDNGMNAPDHLLVNTDNVEAEKTSSVPWAEIFDSDSSPSKVVLQGCAKGHVKKGSSPSKLVLPGCLKDTLRKGSSLKIEVNEPIVLTDSDEDDFEIPMMKIEKEPKAVKKLGVGKHKGPLSKKLSGDVSGHHDALPCSPKSVQMKRGCLDYPLKPCFVRLENCDHLIKTTSFGSKLNCKHKRRQHKKSENPVKKLVKKRTRLLVLSSSDEEFDLPIISEPQTSMTVDIDSASTLKQTKNLVNAKLDLEQSPLLNSNKPAALLNHPKNLANSVIRLPQPQNLANDKLGAEQLSTSNMKNSELNSIKSFITSYGDNNTNENSISNGKKKLHHLKEADLPEIIQVSPRKDIEDEVFEYDQDGSADEGRNLTTAICNYSQIDDVILISSDDEDFPPMYAMVPVKIKVEKIDEDPMEDNIEANHEDMPETRLSLDEEIRKTIVWDQDEGEYRFDSETNLHQPEADTNLSDHDEFFPELSQAFYEDHHSSTARDTTSVTKRRAEWTNALPLTKKPRANCSRDEWIGKTDKFYSNHRALKPVIEKAKPLKPRKIHVNLKNMVQKGLGHRIPIPGGGSAIPMRDEHRVQNQSSSSIEDQRKRKLGESLRREKPGVKRSVPKITTEQRFPSRLNGLIMDAPSKQPQLRLKPATRKTAEQPKTFKIPKRPGAVVEPTDTAATSSISVLEAAQLDTDTDHPSSYSTGSSNKHHLLEKHSTFHKPTTKKLRFEDLEAVQNTTGSNAVPELKKKGILKQGPDFKQTSMQQTNQSQQPTSLGNVSRNVPKVDGSCGSAQLLKKKKECVPMLKPDNLPNMDPVKFSFNIILAQILRWNVQWLNEQVKSQEPPPIFKMGHVYRKVKLSYDSIKTYFFTYYPLLLLEMWEKIYRCSLKVQKQWKVVLTEYQPNKETEECATGTLDMVLEGKDRNNPNLPKEGSLITFILRYTQGNTEKQKMETFGYVLNVTRHQKNALYWRENPILRYIVESEKIHEPLHIRFHVKLKNRHVTPSSEKYLLMKNIEYIKPMLRQAEALSSMHASYLSKFVLIPKVSQCRVNLTSSPGETFHAIGDYNASQKSAIMGAAQAGLYGYAVPKIVLLQGPPGTGKTRTCVGLIQQLIFSSKLVNSEPYRILVLAPSNAAVDEIGRRLIELQESLKKSKPSSQFMVVRVGQSSSMHAAVAAIDLEVMALASLKDDRLEETSKIQRSIDTTSAKIMSLEIEVDKWDKTIQNLVQSKLSTSQEQKRLTQAHAQIARYQKSKQLLLVQLQTNEAAHLRNDSVLRRTKEILKKTNVVLTTLNSSRISILDSVFGNRNSSCRFTACIVDEATQCSEPEVLMPLPYGFSKLFLIGDPRQLTATVTSKVAVKCNFQQSLFERMFWYFEEADKKKRKNESPVIMLTEQYRMHQEICAFPSEHFYKGKLITSPSVNDSQRNFPLRPYTVIDLSDSQESIDPNKKLSSSNSIHNELEAQFVKNLCLGIVKEIPPDCTIGVITPYQDQKSYLGNIFKKSSLGHIEVNTVDGFQGREKDIIIVSSVRANNQKVIGFLSNSKRLNVSLTRAAKCLVICGHLSSLESHAHWRSLINNAKQRDLVVKTNSSINSVRDVLLAIRKKPS